MQTHLAETFKLKKCYTGDLQTEMDRLQNKSSTSNNSSKEILNTKNHNAHQNP